MNKALFLDRDGVVNVDKDYVYKVEDFEFIEGIFELCRTAQGQGYLIVVITNQSGIGRGFYTEDDFQAVTEWVNGQFRTQGITVTRTYYCPYHPEHGIGKYRVDSFDRKPNPGMILKARDELDLDLAASLLIGDKESDMKAAAEAGIGCKMLFAPEGPETVGQTRADVVVGGLDEAAEELAAWRPAGRGEP